MENAPLLSTRKRSGGKHPPDLFGDDLCGTEPFREIYLLTGKGKWVQPGGYEVEENQFHSRSENNLELVRSFTYLICQTEYSVLLAKFSSVFSVHSDFRFRSFSH